MKRIMLFFLTCFLLFQAWGQQKVAVYVIGNDEKQGINQLLSDKMVAAFANDDRYIAVERTESFLAELGKELGYQREGPVSDSQIARLGQQFGVNLVCALRVYTVFEQKTVSVRLIDVSTAQVMNSADAQTKLNSVEEIIRVCNVLKTQLFGNGFENSKVPLGYVDLGLPSGTYWQSASTSEEVRYNYVKEASIPSYAKCPSYSQFQELINECVWTPKEGGDKGPYFLVQGKNGNTIILYARTYGRLYGSYWTSTDVSGKKEYIWYLTFDERSEPLFKTAKKSNSGFCYMVFVKEPQKPEESQKPKKPQRPKKSR